MSTKVQFMALVSPAADEQIACLAVVRRDSKAEIVRAALERYLPEAWEANADGLAVLRETADRLSMNMGELAQRMLRDRLTFAHLAGRTRYPRDPKALRDRQA